MSIPTLTSEAAMWSLVSFTAGLAVASVIWVCAWRRKELDIDAVSRALGWRDG